MHARRKCSRTPKCIQPHLLHHHITSSTLLSCNQDRIPKSPSCSQTALENPLHLLILPRRRERLGVSRCRAQARRSCRKPNTILHTVARDVLVLQGIIDIDKHLIRPYSVPLLAPRRTRHKGFGAVVGQTANRGSACSHSIVEALIMRTRGRGAGMRDRETERAVGRNVDGLTAGDLGVL